MDEKNWKSIWNENGLGDEDGGYYVPHGSSSMPYECCSCLKHRSDCKSLVSIGNPKKPLPFYICEECIGLMYELVWR